MRKKLFLYLSLINLLLSVDFFKSQASMQDICKDFIANGATQKIESTFTYIANNGSSLIHQLTDTEFTKMCYGFLKPVTNVIIEQMPMLHINQVHSNYSEFIANATIPIIGICSVCFTISVGSALYFGYKEYERRQASSNNLRNLFVQLNTLENNIGMIGNNIGMIGNNIGRIQNIVSLETPLKESIKIKKLNKNQKLFNK